MATLQPKSDMNIALRTTCSALQIIEHALMMHDEERIIFSGKDFIEDCMVDGHLDQEKFKKNTGNPYILSPEIGRKMAQEMALQQADFICFNLITEENQEKNEKDPLCKTRTWLIPSKEYERTAEVIANEIKTQLRVRKVPIEKLRDYSLRSGEEITVFKSIKKPLIDRMIDEINMPAQYAISEKNGVCNISMLSKDREKFMQALATEIGYMSGTEGELWRKEQREKSQFASSIMKSIADDRKSFFIGNIQNDGTYHEGIAIDRDGARRLLFTEGMTLVLDRISRSDHMFNARVNAIIKDFNEPAVAEIDSRIVTRDNIKDASKRLVERPQTEKIQNSEKKDKILNYKDYIIKNYYSQLITDQFFSTYRMDVLDRTKNAKWHALENGLTREAEELSKDIAEGSASGVSTKQRTLVGIDLTTISTDAFTQDDLGFPTPAEKYAECLGIDEKTADEIGFTADMHINALMHEDRAIQMSVINELSVYAYELTHNTIEMGEPTIEEQEREEQEREEELELGVER